MFLLVRLMEALMEALIKVNKKSPSLSGIKYAIRDERLGVLRGTTPIYEYRYSYA